jgi:hypothetical protein
MIREQPGRSFLSNPLTWIGFSVPTIVYGINGLHNWDPSLPALNLSIYINDYLRDRPWSDISWFMAYISPNTVHLSMRTIVGHGVCRQVRGRIG